MSLVEQDIKIPLQQARGIVEGLFAPNPLIYWADFLFSVTLGWGSFILIIKFPSLSIWQFILFPVSALALYRTVIFTHELTHLKKDSFQIFRFVWNITCGFPLLAPSFTYQGVHNDHHKRAVYGTKDDGEYLPFGIENPYKILLHILLALALPILFAGRFVVLTPVSYFHKKLRKFVWERSSSLVIDLSYRRPKPSSRDGRTWQLQELFTFLYGVTAIILVARGILPYAVLVLWYLIAAAIFLLNSLRTLAAHRYRNPGDHVMGFSEQYLDSVNIPGHPFLTALWAPVGLRYHATHHLFPTMPYHALGKAHKLLIRELSDNRWYLQTTRKSLWDALRRLWAEARVAQTSRAQAPIGVEDLQ